MIDLIKLKRQQMNGNKYPKMTIHDIGHCVCGRVYFWLGSNAFEAEID